VEKTRDIFFANHFALFAQDQKGACMAERKQVALLMPTGWSPMEIELRGILDYARTHGSWTLLTVPETFVSAGSLRDMRDWEGDGIIGLMNRRRDAEFVAQMNIPVVGVSGALEEGLLPRVLTDNAAIGRMAAKHLLECGFRRLAFVGRRNADDILQRCHGFLEEAATLNARVATFTVPGITAMRCRTWRSATAQLEGFVRGLTLPVGIMACDDVRARMVLEACRSAGLRVPDDVAIIGVDNNESVCEFADPPLSSIERPDRDMGYEAAALLDRMMSGQRVPARDVLLPPKGLVTRRSTDILAIENPHVRDAVAYIREHAGEVFGVERLTEVVPVSRRWLETHFREVMGCTLHQYICRVRVGRAKELLVLEPKGPIQDIAAACGFAGPTQFRTVFQRLTGMSPGAYRRSQHGHAGANR
jgi:LacI family transcriptional regulator